MGKSQYNLALLYEQGKGVDSNLISAYIWFDMAIYKEVPDALRRRSQITQLLSQSDLKRAMEMAAECKTTQFKNCGK